MANQFFNTGVALPSTLFSVWYNLSGVFVAKKWASSKAHGKSKQRTTPRQSHRGIERKKVFLLMKT